MKQITDNSFNWDDEITLQMTKKELALITSAVFEATATDIRDRMETSFRVPGITTQEVYAFWATLEQLADDNLHMTI